MPTFSQIAYDILKKSGKPMHISELTKEVNKIRQIESMTPKNTINLACQNHDKIKRVERGTFQSIK